MIYLCVFFFWGGGDFGFGMSFIRTFFPILRLYCPGCSSLRQKAICRNVVDYVTLRASLLSGCDNTGWSTGARIKCLYRFYDGMILDFCYRNTPREPVNRLLTCGWSTGARIRYLYCIKILGHMKVTSQLVQELNVCTIYLTV